MAERDKTDEQAMAWLMDNYASFDNAARGYVTKEGSQTHTITQVMAAFAQSIQAEARQQIETLTLERDHIFKANGWDSAQFWEKRYSDLCQKLRDCVARNELGPSTEDVDDQVVAAVDNRKQQLAEARQDIEELNVKLSEAEDACRSQMKKRDAAEQQLADARAQATIARCPKCGGLVDFDDLWNVCCDDCDLVLRLSSEGELDHPSDFAQFFTQKPPDVPAGVAQKEGKP